ncbi:oligo-1,6-glucosidase [Rhizobium sp. RU35A]|uniref:alpha-glucosidase n=1 Tax=Rhizobium sp. RU35A TaxID=1907414 RepID=UPI000953A4AB|nr:alpha-glucosidase [Rhizobium sp. RU35A]SIQ33104.1 oligo-1,6-glucosidase [Rhizobium sp. RU35A]
MTDAARPNPAVNQERHWWHSSTVYQIYPRSFSDSNGDGIGDIPGMIERLDYLEELGIDVIWLSPIYTSPMDDNGYDIADYQDIAPEFGTLSDFDRLVAEAKARGIGIVLDLVVNHTSDEHLWFAEACKGRDNPFRDFYVWRDPAPDGGVPNELASYFGGSAWEFHAPSGQYYLHLFSRRQPDLNWENPKVRAEVHRMMNWWLDRGIAGFRMDVIDLIGKQVDAKITSDGPHLHDYLQDMHRETLAGRDVLTVGETWSVTPSSALLYSGRARGELSMVFQFEHVTQRWDETYGKWRSKPADLVALKAVFSKWQRALSEDGWNSLFWGNHDLPRAVSRYGDDTAFPVASAKTLATVLHLMKGTPYIYQGEEIGMTNVPFQSIDQYRDIETLNMYLLQTETGLSPEAFIRGANENSRDNARTPMQWTGGAHGGFTTGTPWIEANPNHVTINAEAAVAEETSVFHHYRRLIALRKTHDVIVYGHYQSWLDQHPQAFVYTRSLGEERLTVIANMSSEPLSLELPDEIVGEGEPLIWTHEPITAIGQSLQLAPWESFGLLLRR